jgi:hypothetical protein
MILDVQFSFKLHLCCYNFIDFHAIFRLCDVMVQMGFEFLFGNKGWMEFHVDGTNSTWNLLWHFTNRKDNNPPKFITIEL